MTMPGATILEQREQDAIALCEETAIILAKKSTTSPATLHLAGPAGGTICQRVGYGQFLGLHPMATANPDRVCETCLAGTSRAYGEQLTAQQVADSMTAFLARR